MISDKGNPNNIALSIQVLPDGFCVFNNPLKDGFIERTLLSDQEGLLQWLGNKSFTESTIKIIYTSPATVVPESLFDSANASKYLEFHVENWMHTAFSKINNFELCIVFGTNQGLETALKEANLSIAVSHSAHELLKRALLIPNKEIPRLVSIFYPSHIEIVYHRGTELLSYNQFDVQGDLDPSYYLQLTRKASVYDEVPAEVICYENGSAWGKKSFKHLCEWALDAQYITEAFPFL